MIPARMTRYALRELFGPTMLALSLYTFVLLMNHFFVIAEKALARNWGTDIIARYFVLGIPELLVMVIPMAVLLGTLIAVGRMSSDQEWTALQAAGHGPRRLLWPVVIHGLAASLVALFLHTAVLPQTNHALRALRGEVFLAANLASDLKPRGFYEDLSNVVLYVGDIRAGNAGRLEEVILIQDFPSERTSEMYVAKRGDLFADPDNEGGLILQLSNGESVRYHHTDPEPYRYLPSFGSLTRRFEPPPALAKLRETPAKSARDRSPVELFEDLWQARADREEKIAATVEANTFVLDTRIRRNIVEIHQRSALSLAPLFLALLGLPLGVTRARSGKGAGFAVSLLVILIYYVLFTFFRDQSATGPMPAAIGPWAGNLVVFPWALFLLWRMHRPPGSGRGPITLLVGMFFRGLRALRFRRSRRMRAAEAGVEQLEEAVTHGLEEIGGTANRFVARIDRYIGWQYLKILLISMAGTYMIYSIVVAKELMDNLLENDLPLSLLLSYLKYFAPGILPVVLPISCLVGAVITFTILARSGELDAIKAAGVSVRRATFSVVLLTLTLCAILFFVQDRIAPTSNRLAQETKDQILDRPARTYGLPTTGRWSFGPDGDRLYHYRFYDDGDKTFQGLSVFTIDRGASRIIDHRYAEKAHWNGSVWELENSWYWKLDDDGRKMAVERSSGVERIGLDAPENFASKQRTLRALDDFGERLSLEQMKTEIAALERSGYDTTRLRVSFHGKWSGALAPMVMVLLGLPFAFRIGRRGSLYGVGVALVLVLVYWAVFAVFTGMGKSTLLDPAVAAWAPNVIFGLLGSYLLLYVRT